MKYIVYISTLIATIFSVSLANAMDIHVTKFNDTFDGSCDSDCSLREAVQLSNSSPGPDHIWLPQGTYRLTIPVTDFDDEGEPLDEDQNVNGDLDITDDVVIEAEWTDVAVINGSSIDRIIENISGSTSIIHVILTDGKTPDYGGAIENHADLTLRYCNISKNKAQAAFRPAAGGAIANFGTMSIFTSYISENHAFAGEGQEGKGGGILNEGILTVRDTLIDKNYANDDDERGSGGGIFNAGQADIRRSLFIKNEGSVFGTGAAIITANGGTLKMVNTTVSDHIGGLAYGGGAVANGAGNTYGPGNLYLTNVTITDNEYFGLYSTGNTYIKNSIIAGNAHPDDGPAKNCNRQGGTLYVEGLLLGSGDNPNCSGDMSIDNSIVFTTLLKPLASNGGRTRTHALMNNSIAIDAGIGACPGFDQTGRPAPLDGNGDGIATCDLGAVEYVAE